MSKDLETFVKRCQPCLVTTESPRPSITPLKRTTLPKAAWLLLGMDFVGKFSTGENLLVLVDYYSRYPEVEIMKHITTAALEPRLRRIFARYGVPQEIVTDNAKTFRSFRFSNLMREFGVKHRKITPRYPRANGEAERLNRSINKVVKTAIESHGIGVRPLTTGCWSIVPHPIRSPASHQQPLFSDETSTTSSHYYSRRRP